MVTCPNCGTVNPDTARFCMSCGHLLAVEAPSREARKVVTVVFADVTGSTGLGERLDPESLRAIMGRWFEAMREVLERHDGTVEKFIGDAVVAVFGVPVLHEDDALRAVRAADGMSAALNDLNVALKAERDLEIQMRVGVNTGPVVVGDARAGGSRATGDAVNVAARLQQAAEPGETLVGDSTWRLVRDAITAGEPREIQVKGRDEPVVVRSLLGVDQTAEAIHRRVGGPMVGRSRELGILRAAYERAVIEERCVLVTVLGSAGVGKSRLTHEFLTGVRPAATVLRGRCLPYGHGITWYPVASLLHSAVGLDDEADPNDVLAGLKERLAGLADADTILARLAEPLGIASSPAPIEEVFWAVRRLIERLATQAPVVVVLDDLQWADPTLLDLVEHLADWISGIPVVLLALARPELLDTRAGWGGGKPDATTFLLEPLPAADTEELVGALFEGAAVTAQVRTRIAAAADGNPLYVEQVIEMLLDDGLVRRLPDGSLQVGDLETMNVPATIQALLAARLDRLTDPERRTIERASVVGKEFGQRDVSELTPAESRDGVTGQLMALVRKELIRPDRRRDDGAETYRFRHLLIRDAAYDSLPKAERAELHERFADWLERTAGDRIADLDEIVGYHLDQARTYRLALGPEDERTRALGLRAGRRLAAAGRRAFERDEVRTAIRLLSQAERLLGDDPGERFLALIALSRAAFFEDFTLGGEAARHAEALGTELGGVAALRGAIWVIATRAMTDPDFEISSKRPEIEAATRAFEATDDVDAMLDGYQTLLLVNIQNAHWNDAVVAARHGLAIAAENGRDIRRGDFVGWLANALQWGSSPARAAIATIEGLLASETRRLTRSKLLSSIAVLRGVLGDRDGAEAASLEAASIRQELGYHPTEFRNAYTAYLLGDFEVARRLAQVEAADLERRGETGMRSTMLGLDAWVAALMGDVELAVSQAEESRRLAAADDAVSQILWRSAMGLAKARTAPEDADRLTREATEVAEGTDSTDAGTAWEARAMALSILGRPAEATAAAKRARELYAGRGGVNGLRRVEALIVE